MDEKIWGIIGGIALLLALLSPLVLGNSKKVERLFEDAKALHERSNYENAIEKYKKALKESNKSGAKTEHIDKDFTTLVNFKIAQCYYHLAEKTQDINYYRDALVHIKNVSSKAHEAVQQEELIHLWADSLYKTGEIDLAASKFNQLIKNFPKSRWISKALYTVGEINYQQKNRDKALSTFQQLVDEFPHSEYTTKAEQRITELSRQDKPNPPDPIPIDKSILDKANDSKQQGKVHDAYELYTDLITRFPESEHVTNAYVGKAEIHLEAEDYVKARENYEEAIYSTDDEERRVEIYGAYHRTYLTPDPIYPTPLPEPNDELFTKGMLLRMEGRFLEAAKTFEELANSSLSTEDILSGLYWSGRCYHDASLFTKSVNAYNELITDYENSSYTIKTYYYLALAYKTWAETLVDQLRSKAKYNLTIDTVKEANAKYVNNNDSSVRGWLSRMEDIKNKALEKLTPPLPDSTDEEDHIAQNTEDPKTHIEQENKNTESTQENNEHPEPIKKEIPNKDEYYGRGLTFFDESQYASAIEAFKNAIEIDSEFKEAHFYLGVIYIKKKKHTEAIKAFEEAIRIDPNFKQAYYNLSLVHLERNSRAKAREAARSALKIDPKYEPARLLIEFVTD